MRALIFKDYGLMEVADMPPPVHSADEAIVEVAACGICGSDLEGYTASPGMRRRRVPPLLLGHEFAGVVVDGPATWKGQAVAVQPFVRCGHCAVCRSSSAHLCPERQLIGLQRPGAYAERVAVPVSQLFRLPEGLPAWKAAMVEPLAVALHALTLGPVERGQDVLVLGGGAIGYLVAWSARRLRARVQVVEVHDGRRAQLASWGFDAVAAADREAHISIDTVGAEATRRAAVDRVISGGTAVFVGLHDNESRLPFYTVVLSERRIQGSMGYTDDDFRAAVDQVAEIPSAFYTTMPLEAGPQAFEILAQGKASHLKILLQPRKDGRV